MHSTQNITNQNAPGKPSKETDKKIPNPPSIVELAAYNLRAAPVHPKTIGFPWHEHKDISPPVTIESLTVKKYKEIQTATKWSIPRTIHESNEYGMVTDALTDLGKYGKIEEITNINKRIHHPYIPRILRERKFKVANSCYYSILEIIKENYTPIDIAQDA